jgi:beta-glucosidase
LLPVVCITIANHAGDAQHCSGRSADHWNRVAEDVSLIESLGVQQFRMSIEWSRIEPQEGVIDQAALNHYRDEVRLLKSRGIEPLITLQHFTLPQWVAEKGGWEWEGMPDAFSRYSIRVYRAIRNEASIFITMNEPNLMLAGGYMDGRVPPSYNDPVRYFGAIQGLLKTHAKTYRELKRWARHYGKTIQVGLSYQSHGIIPENDPVIRAQMESMSRAMRDWILQHLNQYFADRFSALFNPMLMGLNEILTETIAQAVAFPPDRVVNWILPESVYNGRVTLISNIEEVITTLELRMIQFLASVPGLSVMIPLVVPAMEALKDKLSPVIEGLRGTQDFYGFQYYTSHMLHLSNPAGENPMPGRFLTDMNWAVYPEGMLHYLREIHSKFPELPIMITESGIADTADTLRPFYIEAHLRAVLQAIGDGIQIKNFCYWTLTDNFEWDAGYGKDFGLFEIEGLGQPGGSLRRIRRRSADYFERVSRENRVFSPFELGIPAYVPGLAS